MAAPPHSDPKADPDSSPSLSEITQSAAMQEWIHMDTELAARDLLNNRMAYVSVSRGSIRRATLHQRPRDAARGTRPRYFKADCVYARDQLGADDDAAGGNLERKTARARYWSWNRPLESCLPRIMAAQCRAQTLSRPTEARRYRGCVP